MQAGKQTAGDRQASNQVPEGLVWSDEGKRVFSRRFDGSDIQGDGKGGEAQLKAVLVGVNPEVMTPNCSKSPASCVLHRDLSVKWGRGGALLASGCQQRCNPTIANLWKKKEKIREEKLQHLRPHYLGTF